MTLLYYSLGGGITFLTVVGLCIASVNVITILIASRHVVHRGWGTILARKVSD
jgi:hypothetical protein